LQVTIPIWGHLVDIEYRVGNRGYGPSRITVDGTEVPSKRVPSPYREGGLAIPREVLTPLLHNGSKMVVEIP